MRHATHLTSRLSLSLSLPGGQGYRIRTATATPCFQLVLYKAPFFLSLHEAGLSDAHILLHIDKISRFAKVGRPTS